MLAARYGHNKTCQLLIAHGADINNETLVQFITFM